MAKNRFYRRWKGQYVRGVKKIGKKLKRCRKAGDAETVHELRVAIRRTRLLTLMGRPALGRKRALAFRAWAQRIADALSPVRDYDVMIEWASTASDDPEMIGHLRKARRQAWNKARGHLTPMSAKAWRKLFRLKSSATKRRKLAARYRNTSQAARKLIEADAASFEHLNAAQRHDLRRTLRRFRYLQELADAPRHDPPAPVERLARVQEMLGELQNAEVMKGLLATGHNHVGHRRQLMRRVKRHEAQWYPRCRRSLRNAVNSLR